MVLFVLVFGMSFSKEWEFRMRIFNASWLWQSDPSRWFLSFVIIISSLKNVKCFWNQNSRWLNLQSDDEEFQNLIYVSFLWIFCSRFRNSPFWIPTGSSVCCPSVQNRAEQDKLELPEHKRPRTSATFGPLERLELLASLGNTHIPSRVWALR